VSVDRILELNCLVLGDDPNHVFAVEISNAKTVSALKKAIKNEKKHTFQHVDADALVLWNVSVPVDRSLEENINNFFLANEESLSPVHKLSKVFPDLPEEEHLHIVVKSPPIGECESLVASIGSDFSTSFLACCHLHLRNSSS